MSGRHRKPSPARAPGRHRRLPPQRHRQPPEHHLVAPALAAAVLLSAGGVAAAAAFTGGDAAAPPRVPTIVLGTSISSPSPSPPAGRLRSTPHPEEVAAAALTVRVTGRVAWVEVTRPSGRAVLAGGLLRHGREVVVRRGPARLVIGDAGAVRVSRHGGAAHRPGRQGQVVVLRVR